MSLSQDKLDFLIKEVDRLKKENQELHELLAMSKRKIFGSSSEKVNHQQLGFFDETESTVTEEEQEQAKSVEGYTRKRGKRLKLPDNLPRVEKIIDIDNKVCSEDGSELKCIGEDVSEQLEIIPAKVQVIRTIRKKYSCPECEAMKVAPAPAKLIPKSNASASLLSYIASSKYCDALPLYRQESIFNRIGVDLSRQSMARWMIKVGEAVQPVIDLMNQKLLAGHYLHMDETRVQVLNEEGRRAQSHSYMWVTTRSTNQPIVLFNYNKSRSSEYPSQFLKGYRGAIQVDGYDGYQRAVVENQITRLGCWAHARRKFFDAFKSSNSSKVGKHGIAVIKKLYKTEKKISDGDNGFLIRLKESIPILQEFKIWLEDKKLKVTPSSLAGKAINYTLNEWEYLMNCFTHSDYKLDNNFVESRIRPFTIGRKNWMFSSQPAGAVASANIYSLVETAKANKIDPFSYLNMLFERLPLVKNEADLKLLLPF